MSPITFILTIAITQFGAVKGKVTQIDGTTPVVGMRVDAYNALTKSHIYCDWTDTLGSYIIDRLPSGEYKIRTYDFTSTYANLYYNNILYWESAETIAVSAPDTIPGIDFYLPTGGKINGTLYHGDGITPYKGYAMAGAYFTSNGDMACIAVKDTTTGDYKIGGLQSGLYKLMVAPMGYEIDIGDTIYAFEFYNNACNWTAAQDIQITLPDSVLGTNITFDTCGTISGHIYESDGITPIDGAFTTCFSYFNEFYGWAQYCDTKESDAGGFYKLYNLMSGDYKVRTTKIGYDTVWYNNKPDIITADIISIIMPNHLTDIDLQLSPTGVDANPMGRPPFNEFKLIAFPNPFRSTTTIKFQLPRKGYANLSLYNIKGELVKTLTNGMATSGGQQFIWRGDDRKARITASGIYFIRLQFEGRYFTARLTLLR